MRLRHGWVLALLLAPQTPAFAQGWDMSGFIGVLPVHAADDSTPGYQDWFTVAHGGATVGRYLSPHVKLEVEAAASGTGTQFVQRFVTVPGFLGPYPISGDRQTSLRWLGASVVYQFFDNEWVHPFVSAGAGVEAARTSLRFWEQRYYGSDPRVPPGGLVLAADSIEGPDTETALAGIVAGGVKLYVSPRVFFRTEARVTFGSDRQHLAFRGGAGIDF